MSLVNDLLIELELCQFSPQRFGCGIHFERGDGGVDLFPESTKQFLGALSPGPDLGLGQGLARGTGRGGLG